MPTKYELQAKLRELNRGFPRLPITSMRIHELEAAIEAIEKVRDEGTTILSTKTMAKPGPKGPRPVEVEEVESDGLTIRTPKAPAPRVVRKEKKPVESLKLSFSDDEDSEEPVAKLPAPKPALKPAPKPTPAPAPAPEAKTKSEKVTVHFCNCPNCHR